MLRETGASKPVAAAHSILRCPQIPGYEIGSGSIQMLSYSKFAQIE